MLFTLIPTYLQYSIICQYTGLIKLLLRLKFFFYQLGLIVNKHVLVLKDISLSLIVFIIKTIIKLLTLT